MPERLKRVSNVALFLVVLKRHHGSEGVKAVSFPSSPFTLVLGPFCLHAFYNRRVLRFYPVTALEYMIIEHLHPTCSRIQDIYSLYVQFHYWKPVGILPWAVSQHTDASWNTTATLKC